MNRWWDKPLDLVRDNLEDLERRRAEADREAARVETPAVLASGGWCAPSHTVYVGDYELLHLPEISVTRGGIRHV